MTLSPAPATLLDDCIFATMTGRRNGYDNF
jgi:hypothetical protein